MKPTNLADAKVHFDGHGYVNLPAFVSAEELKPAQASLGRLFPTAEEFHGGTALEMKLGQRFPYTAVEWSLLTVAPPLVQLAETLLGTKDIRVSEAHNWAKFSGASDYDQDLHRDFGNHTVVAPSPDPAFGEVEIFMWIHDVADDAGPTRIVSRTVTDHLPIGQARLTREEAPDVYDAEVSAAGPAGTVLAYRNDTFHRGTAMTAPRGSRYALKVSFSVNGPYLRDRLGLLDALGLDWVEFVNRATPRMLELFSFPPPGHPYWTPTTYAAVCFRYPDADLRAFAPAD